MHRPIAAVLLATGAVVAASGTLTSYGDPSPAARRLRAPSYHRDVAPILRKHCTACHREGDIAPFALDDHASAAEWIDYALDEIEQGAMPPWRPTRGVGQFQGERGLSAKERRTLERWRDAGAPEGRRPRGLRPPQYPTGWVLGDPDIVLDYGESFTVAANEDDIYRCFPVATEFEGDVFVRGIDVQPGDRRVVHHVVLYIDTAGQSHALDDGEEGPGYTCFGGPGFGFDFSLDDLDAADLLANGLGAIGSPVLGGWAPGARPVMLARGTGIRIPQGATVVVQVHYHSLQGETVDDRSTVGLYVTGDPETTDVFLLPLVNQDFTIPADDPAHVVTQELSPSDLIEEYFGIRVPLSGHVLAVLPHMHLLGSEIRVDLELPDGTEQRLVEIRDWDFEWQDSYHFKRPVPIPDGARFRLRCVFDNSAANPNNPNVPPQPVAWGERTVDEMALAFLAVTLRLPPELDPDTLGEPPIEANAPPRIRTVRIDRRGRLVVTARHLAGGGRIELDGIALDDSLRRRRRATRLLSDVDWESLLPAGATVDLRVRRADGRLSAPVSFTREP